MQQIKYAFISICMVLVIFFGGYFIYQQFNATYPRTAQRNIEKQSLESIALSSSLEEQLIDAPFDKADVTYMNYFLAEMQSAFLEDLILTKLLRDEYAPSAEDSADDLWANGVLFLRINLLDEAIECFQAHLTKAYGTYPDPTLYVPKVITFVNQIKNTGINYGAMIIAYDETLQMHDFYEIGDVIVAVNGERCENLNDYRSLIIDGEENVITVLRFDEDENFAFYEYIRPVDSTQSVYMGTLAEG